MSLSFPVGPTIQPLFTTTSNTNWISFITSTASIISSSSTTSNWFSIISGSPTTLTTMPRTTASPSSLPGRVNQSCLVDLDGQYVAPNFIIPVNKALPNQVSGGTGYYGCLSSTASTVFTFDIPSSYANRTCSIIFLLSTSQRYTITGSGGLTVSLLSSTINAAISYAALENATKVGGVDDVVPGTNAVMWSQQCEAGSRQSILLQATGSLNLTYFQTRGEPANGLWYRVC